VWVVPLFVGLLLAQLPPGESPTPVEAVKVIHADLARQPASVRPYLRYLLRPVAWTDKDWEYFRPVLAGHCNHLSRQPILAVPARVGSIALRVNITDYGWKAETFDRLYDPFTTIPVVEAEKHPLEEYEWWKGGVWPDDGRYYPPKAFQVRRAVVKAYAHNVALAPWLLSEPEDKGRLAEIVNWTQSRAPFVRSDWFFNQTAAQQARDPGYYDFLEVKTEADVFKMVGFDEARAKEFRFELREAVSVSTVTHNPRGIVRWDTLSGVGLWRSIDFKRETLAKLKAKGITPIKTTGRELENHADGFEGFAGLPNAMWFTWGANKKRELLDAVPGEIAGDTFSKTSNKQVQPNAVCLRCHASKAGLNDIDGWFRNSLNPPLELRFYDYDKAVETRQQYLRKLEPFMARDRAAFEEAVIECTGLKASEYLKRYTELWEKTEDAIATTEYVAADWGLTAKDFRERITAAIKTGYTYADVPVGAWVHTGARARRLGIRDYWDEIPVIYGALKAGRK
jgi:hypothetical protein